MTPNNDATASKADIQALGHSPDAQQERQQELIDLLRQAAPEVLSDNQVDLERLKELLGEERLAPAEHYELSWAGKKDARREIQKKTSHTLRPDANNPESAQHMLIEGENLEVLRVLQKSYYGKVKMIYIDPPYNTGNDSFVYPDDYSETLEEYQKRTGEKSEAGFLNKQSLWKKNSKESGQYHSAWLSMMYPRLYLARNLLRDDGVIFISIDEHEVDNLKLLCDEIFGEENVLGTFPVVMNLKGNQDAFGFAETHEYFVACCKLKDKCAINYFPLEVEEVAGDWQEDDYGLYKVADNLRATGVNAPREKRPNLWYPIFLIEETGEVYCTENDEPRVRGHIAVWPVNPEGTELSWYWGKSTFMESRHNLIIKRTTNGWQFYRKQRPQLGDVPTKKAKSFFYKPEYSTSTATTKLKELFGKKIFENPKPVPFVSDLIILGSNDNDIVLDFFAGSGTTAHAVMDINAEDGGNRQFISIQLPENLEENTESYKAGYRTIADITRARIEKVIAKLKVEYPEKTANLACANFTLSPSNFKVWNSELNDLGAIHQQLDALQNTENYADEQTAMLTELLLKNGLGALGVHAISKPRKLACGVTVHRVLREDDCYLWLCFEPYVDALRSEILNASPAQVIMLNSCFVGSQGDEHLSNLQLELAAQDISLLVI